MDLRGHGQSAGARGLCMRFGEYTDDAGLLIARARQALPDKPLFLLGHSFGGLIAAKVALDRSSEIAGMVVSSPYYKLKLHVPKVKALAGKLMSKIFPGLALPSGLKGADVARDPEIVALYDRDPLNNKKATARWFTETNDAQAELLARAPEIKTPSLFLVGGDDKIADSKRAEEVFARLGSADKTIHVLAGQYHEIFNEIMETRTKNLATMVAWLKDRHASATAAELRAQGS